MLTAWFVRLDRGRSESGWCSKILTLELFCLICFLDLLFIYLKWLTDEAFCLIIYRLNGCLFEMTYVWILLFINFLTRRVIIWNDLHFMPFVYLNWLVFVKMTYRISLSLICLIPGRTTIKIFLFSNYIILWLDQILWPFSSIQILIHFHERVDLLKFCFSYCKKLSVSNLEVDFSHV